MVGRAKAEWFLAPPNIKPDSTLVLGKIIADPRYPSGPPCLDTIAIESSQITELKYPWSKREERGKGGSMGVFLSFLSMVGVGGDTTASLQLKTSTEIDVEELQVRTFEAKSDFVQKVLDLPSNVRELGFHFQQNQNQNQHQKQRRRIRPLYVVTGLQVARGGTVTKSASRAWSGDASIGVTPNLPGVDVGVKGGLNRSTSSSETRGKHDFVYAFKLNKVSYSRKTNVVQLDRYTKGAAFGRDDDDDNALNLDLGFDLDLDVVADGEKDKTDLLDKQTQKLNKNPEPVDFQVLGVQSHDAGENEFGVEGKSVGSEDGEEYIVIDPTTIPDDSEDEDEEDGDEDEDED